MAKKDGKHPDFECIEYDYAMLPKRKYTGTMHITIRFDDEVDVKIEFEFKEFLDFHKRKKTAFYRALDPIYADMSGWGSRYFDLVETLQDEDDIDLFAAFTEFIEHNDEELTRKYELKCAALKHLDYSKEIQKQKQKETTKSKKNRQSPMIDNLDSTENDENDDEDDEDDETLYDYDRKRFKELLEQASDDMYDVLQMEFLPQMDHFQRRYPSRWKKLTENIEIFLQSFEDEMLHEMLPEIDEEEYKEFDIKYNSQKADMSNEDEPPTAR